MMGREHQVMMESSSFGAINHLVNARLVYYPGVFSAGECSEIVTDFARFPTDKGRIGTGDNYDSYNENKRLRDCYVTYARKDAQNAWFLDKLENLMLDANSSTWQLDVRDFSQPPRLMTYHAQNHFKSMHSDHGPGVTCFRKLTAVVQLSDPNQYVGGDFEIAGEPVQPKYRTQGGVIIFPAYLFHKVHIVTSGTRQSLVHRAIGPALR